MKIEISAGKQDKKIEDYEVEDAFRTLLKSEEIRANPELMAKVKQKAKAHKTAISSIADLKDAYSQMVKIKKEEDFKRKPEEVAFEKEVQSE